MSAYASQAPLGCGVGSDSGGGAGATRAAKAAISLSGTTGAGGLKGGRTERRAMGSSSALRRPARRAIPPTPTRTSTPSRTARRRDPVWFPAVLAIAAAVGDGLVSVAPPMAIGVDGGVADAPALATDCAVGLAVGFAVGRGVGPGVCCGAGRGVGVGLGVGCGAALTAIEPPPTEVLLVKNVTDQRPGVVMRRVPLQVPFCPGAGPLRSNVIAGAGPVRRTCTRFGAGLPLETTVKV
jgi:hypothetical protein